MPLVDHRARRPARRQGRVEGLRERGELREGASVEDTRAGVNQRPPGFLQHAHGFCHLHWLIDVILAELQGA